MLSQVNNTCQLQEQAAHVWLNLYAPSASCQVTVKCQGHQQKVQQEQPGNIMAAPGRGI
jgi:hypothetical protein